MTIKISVIPLFIFVFLIGILSFAEAENTSTSRKEPVLFSINEGSGGCANCGNAVKKLLKDQEKLSVLSEIFQNYSNVVFYVRNFDDKTIIRLH